MLRATKLAVVAAVHPVPAWVIAAGSAFATGATAAISQASLGPIVEDLVRGDLAGAGKLVLPIVVSALVGGLGALLALAKRLPTWLQTIPSPLPPEDPPQV